MELLIRGAAIGIVAAIIGLMIKKNSPDMAMLLTVAAGILILYYALSMVSGIVEYVRELAGFAGISSALLSPVIKSVGIAAAGRIGSDVCKDAGNNSTAAAVELISAAAVIYISIPLMRTVLKMLESFM